MRHLRRQEPTYGWLVLELRTTLGEIAFLKKDQVYLAILIDVLRIA
jgi:hypothetical protein